MANLENNLEFRTSATLTTAGSSVAITNDIERDQTVTLTDAYMVFTNRTGSVIERVKGNASGGTLTLTKRGLDQSMTDTEVTGLKQSRPAGTRVYVTILSSQLADRQNDNDFFGDINHAGTVAFNGTTPIGRLQFPRLTTAERDALTAVNGEIIYNTDDSVLQQYIGGGWNDVGNTGTPDASTTVAGKVEIATDAEVGAGTQTGGTGADLVVNPTSVVKTSSGASDENKLAALNASGQFADGFINADAILSEGVDNLLKEFTAREDIDIRDPMKLGVENGFYFGQTVEGDTTTAADTRICSIGTDKFLVTRRVSTNFYGIVATISDNVVTFGTRVTIASSLAQDFIDCCTLGTDKALAMYTNNTNDGRVVVLTVSGTTITVNSSIIYDNAVSDGQALCPVDDDKALVVYNGGTSSSTEVRILTVSGTTITSNSPDNTALSSVTDYQFHTTKLSTTKVAISLRDDGDSNKGKAFIVTISGTTPTIGTVYEYDAGGVTNKGIVTIDTDKILIAYNDGADKTIVGTISGSVISFGTEAATYSDGICVLGTDKAFAFNNVSSKLQGQVINISTTTITTEDAFLVRESNSSILDSLLSDNGQILGLYNDADNSNRLSGMCFSEMTAGSVYKAESEHTDHLYFLGFANEAISSGGTGKLVIDGVLGGFSGLTSGALYYLNDDYTISTTASTNSLGVCRAISTTEIIIDKSKYTYDYEQL